ncbi:transglycosylase domain-containing protein [Virgibacillus alimentarius]|uniref:transglycosylase domain-containing protein n=1 Tax=Virgibacillus alimentarius TaxID=698769 RepID=UPI00068BB28A|nr:transglycosylase domain-containing protein [Virgibacillus alimentarius]
MDLKETLRRYYTKIKSIVKNEKLQKNFRITYDIMWNIILLLLLTAFIGLFFIGGMGAGYFASLVKDEPIRSYENMKKDIYNYEETSKLYFSDGKYYGDVRSDIYREEVSLDQVSDTLINAVIATEDQYFNEHEGVVPKAIVRAIVQEVTNSNVKTGGSTLTQQLIKNQILTNEVSFDRKAKEILLALRLENFFTKDQILEAYLNIIPYGREASGGNVAGVQTAAKGIFGVDAEDANLPQAAFLAGLPQSPSYYTPFTNEGKLKDKENLQPGLNRMKTVLNRMYEEGYITKKEYKKAIDYDIIDDFIEKPKKNPQKSYFADEVQKRAKFILKNILAKKDGYTKEDLKSDQKLNKQYTKYADRALRRNGYKIHTTIDKEIYNKFQEVVKNYQHFGPDITAIDENGEEITDPVQAGAVLIENHTGKIISFVGGRDYSKENQVNFATQSKRSNGSTMKPILTYAPAFEEGIIQPGTPLADFKMPSDGWLPDNYAKGEHGLVSAREALTNSYNIPVVRVYKQLIDGNLGKKYMEKMGITTISDDEYTFPSLSIGGTTHGVTVEENTNAFSTFGNDGKFRNAYMIEKITTSDGEVIYKHESEPVKVFSPETAYLTLDIMRDVINKGTGTYIKSQLKHNDVDWAGKTGTSNDYKDAWFVGTNPNVTFGAWIGYDSNHGLDDCPGCSLSYSQRNMSFGLS